MYLDPRDSLLYIEVFRLLAVCSCFVSLYVLICNCSTIDLVQNCTYRFGIRFGLAIGMRYFGTDQYRHSVSGLPQIYIYIY